MIEPLYGYLLLAKKQYENQLINIEPVWNFGPKKTNFINVAKICEIFKKYDSKLKTKVFKNSNNIYNESIVLMLDSKKSRKYLGWKPSLKIHQSVNKIMEWNNLKKKMGAYKITEKQIIEYLK